MGSCPFPFLLAFLAPFVLGIFRTAGRKPKSTGVAPLKPAPGRYLPHQEARDPEPVTAR
ncbi:MAG: hypothetical protein U0556_16530 [Dehalococcoidia bacterium]